MDKKIFIPEKYGMEICTQDVTAKDIFKIQNVTLVQMVGGLGSLKRKQNRTRRFSRGKIMGIGALNDRIVE